MAKTKKKKQLPPKESKGVVYLKNISKSTADWFRKEAKRLGYTMNEFFEVMVKDYSKGK